MALGTNHTTKADVAVMQPEVWVGKVNDVYFSKLKLANFFENLSDEVIGGGDTLHIPNLARMSKNAKVNGNQVTLNKAKATGTPLVVDTWEEVSFIIEDLEAAQIAGKYSLEKRYAVQGGKIMSEALEVAIAKKAEGATKVVGSGAANLSEAVIYEAIAELESDNVDIDETAFFLHPNTFWRQLEGITKFINRDFGAGERQKGRIAGIHGIPVITSSLIQLQGSGTTLARVNFLATADAIAFATASLPDSPNSVTGDFNVRMQTQYQQEYLGYLTTTDLAYGATLARNDSIVKILSHPTYKA